MRSRSTAGRILIAVASGLALITAAACSSSSTSSVSAPASSSGGSSSAPGTSAPASSSSASSSTAAEPASGSGAQSAITANWESFFGGKTSAATKVSLLQNGQKFASVINGQAGSPMSESAKATVTGITIKGTSAAVKYNIGITGASLNNQSGTAVYEDGVWKVGDVSFCQLLTLENLGQTPPVCK